jgi:PAS domain S-box-containing protein
MSDADASALTALLESEATYRALFASMDEGYLLAEVLFDEAGRAADLLYLQSNEAAIRMTGRDYTGRRLMEIAPEYELYWTEIWGRVVRTGISERLERYAAPLDKWFDFHVSRVGGEGSHRAAVVFRDITAKKQAEKALRASEARHAFLVQLNDRLRPLTDPAAIQYEAARTLGEYLGASRVGYGEDCGDGETAVVTHNYTDGVDGIEGLHHYVDFGPDQLEAFRAGRTHVRPDVAGDPLLTDAEKAAHAALGIGATLHVPLLKAGQLVAVIFVHHREPRRWVAEDLALVEDMAARTWDAVERARAEAALRASEERLRVLLESVSDYAIFTIDGEARVTSWNDGARRLTGWTAEEILGQSIERFYPPDDVAAGKVPAEMARALEAGRSEDENWRVRKDGSRFWCNEIMTPLRDAGGRVIGFSKISRDLTERRRAEELVRASEEQLRLVVESVADHAIITLGLDGRVTSWNQGAERMFGWAAEEIVGHDTAVIFTPEDRERRAPEEELRRARDHGRAEDERWHERRDGTRLYVSGVVNPLRPDGVLTGYVKVARDNTERKRMEDALRQTREEAEQANRAKDEFLAMLGHELRNPLAPIVTAMELMRLKGSRLPELEIVDRQVGHMRHLVDDLLDVSRITRGKLELDQRPMEVREVVDRAMEQAGPLLEQRLNRVDVQLPWRGLGIDADRNRMAQVIANLLTNASKYSDPGSRIVLRGERDGDVVRISVADEGIGIAPEMLGTVFEPFVQQGQSIERSRGGLGLGLAIVRSLVTAHGGRVRAESAGPGQGSTFVVELPAQQLPERTSHRRAPERTSSRSGRGRRVLIVDDNVDAADTLRTALEQMGYVVDVASDGPSALEHAAAFRPAVVLLDIGLPFMDGYEVARQLRATWEDDAPRLLAVTGYGQASDRERTHAAGFDEHLVKPIDLQQLRHALEDSSEN